MLKTFRTFGSTKASKVMLSVLVFCFVGWGVAEYLTKQVGMEAVTVNGEGLSVQELDQLYQARMQQLANLMGGRVAPEVLRELKMDQVVMTEAVNRAIMRQTASHLGLMPATDAVRDEIFAMPEFKGIDGFDANRYQSAVSRAGLTTAAFEKSVAQDMSVRLMGQLAMVKAPAPEAIAPLLALDSARYDVEWLRIAPATLPAMPEPSDAQLEGFLRENSNVFMVPERRDVLVLAVTPDHLASSTEVTDEQVAEYYAANKTLYDIPEKRLVRHILLASEKEATDLRPQVTDMEALKTLAAQHSTDTASAKDGGSIGLVAKDEVVDAFANAAFGMGIGEVSAPVQTPFGWHILVVEKIEPAHTLPMTEVKPGIIAALKDQVAEEAMYDIQQQIDDKVAGGANLEDVAKDIGLSVKKYPRLAANEEALPQELHNAAFGVEAGEVSSPVEGTDGSVTYVQATSVTPAQEPPLADVRDRVKTVFLAAQRSAALQGRGDAVLKAFEEGSTLEQAAMKANVSAGRGTLSLKGVDDAPTWLHPYLTRLMQVPTGEVLNSVLIDGDDAVVVRVGGREITAPDAAALQTAGKVYAQRLQADYEGMLIGELSRKAKVVTNETRLRQVFGEPTETR